MRPSLVSDKRLTSLDRGVTRIAKIINNLYIFYHFHLFIYANFVEVIGEEKFFDRFTKDIVKIASIGFFSMDTKYYSTSILGIMLNFI